MAARHPSALTDRQLTAQQARGTSPDAAARDGSSLAGPVRHAVLAHPGHASV